MEGSWYTVGQNCKLIKKSWGRVELAVTVLTVVCHINAFFLLVFLYYLEYITTHHVWEENLCDCLAQLV